MMGTLPGRMLLGVLAVTASVLAVLTNVGTRPTPATAATGAAVSSHVVVVGLSGLRWADVSPSETPALWQLALAGSPGSLVDYAVLPRTCPADAWLTLNGGDRAQPPHGEKSPCPALPAVAAEPRHGGHDAGPGPAHIAAMPSLVSYNHTLKYSPRWGLLASAAGHGNCATAVGPGAALALAGPGGDVGSYLPSVSAVSHALLARCPLTVVDLGSLPSASGSHGGAARTASLRHADSELAAIGADLPAGTTLMVAALGAGTLPAHLQVVEVSGAAYRSGQLTAPSTRQPGMVVLTDLTPTVLGWRGQPRPVGLPGSLITRTDRGAPTAVIRGLAGQDTTYQVWTSTHTVFFWTYALVDVAAFAGIGLLLWGGQPDRRRRRAALWRIAGPVTGAVPAGSFLANLVPWWLMPHPAIWQYGLTVAGTVAVSAIALGGPWRRDPFGPPGAVAAATVLIVGVDVISGSRLQLGSPFGLSALEAGRFYGIGGESIGLYAVCGIIAAAWAGNTLLRRRRPGPGRDAGRAPGRPGRGRALLAAFAVAVFVVVACGWPQFGGKVGGTIAVVPCFLLLLMVIAGVRITPGRVLLVLGSGVALFALFALVNYLVPATGQSDIGTFAGNLIHGHAGGLLQRKWTSMIGSLAVNTYSPLVPLVIVLAGLMLFRPSVFGIKALPRGYSAEPLMAITLAMMWLVCVLGWFADDSGIIVPATALPLALPLGFALLAGVPFMRDDTAQRGPAVTGSSVTGRVG
ncbi:MAG: hypothetical protein ACLPKE_07705 [Streptosporangiaceae bacterium]